LAEPRFLADTSVFIRIDLGGVEERLRRLRMAGKLWTCRVVDLELVYSTRQREVVDLIAERRTMPEARITTAVAERALEVAGLMAAAQLHRGAKPADLLIAAAAEAQGLTVLHYDRDFDRIAEVTGQPTEWIAGAGSLDH
jgi:predicted nucleic acid-binding protein